MTPSTNSPKIIGMRVHSEAAPAAEAWAMPRTPIEQTLVDIWREVLPVHGVTPGDNLFALGGDSLLATQVAARIREVFGVELGLPELFAQPTVAGMAERIQAALARAPQPPLPALERAERGGPLPLSFGQERLWFVHQLQPDSTADSIAVALRLQGAFEASAMEASLNELVARHEALRSTFPLVDGRPAQVVEAAAPRRLNVVELQGLPAESRLAEALRIVQRDAAEPFDLARGPVLRVGVYRLAIDDHLLLLNMHHIVSDGWSMSVLGRELLSRYDQIRRGQAAPHREPPAQMADFAVWQRGWLQGPVLENLLNYWRRQLDGVAVLELPTDRPRPAVQTYRGAMQTAALDADLLVRLRQLSAANQATLSMTMLAAFQALLARYTGQTDIAVALPIANRRWVAVEGLIGALVNTLVLRTDTSGDPSFRELLGRVRAVALDAYAHQDMPFARLVAELNPARSLRHSPLAQVMFNYLNVPMPRVGLAGLQVSVVELDRQGAQFDLTLTVVDVPQLERLQLEYNTDLFDAGTAERFLEHYLNLLRALAESAETVLSRLPLMGPAEREQVLVAWSRTQAAYPTGVCVQALFEAQAARTPEAVALRYQGATVRYGELNRRANQLARHLVALGVGRGSLVGIAMPRSPEQVMSLLAVLKAGAAFVPLDPSYPPERLRYMVTDAGARVVLVTGATDLAQLKAAGDTPVVHVVAVADEWAQIAAHAEADLPPLAQAGDPLYVIYTSGSTGRPKGVVAPHRATVNRVYWQWSAWPYAAGEVAGQKTAFSFVDYMAELFVPLLAGVPVAIIPDAEAQDPRRLVAALAAEGVTRLILVPSLLQAMLTHVPNLAARLPRLTLWSVGGEFLPSTLAADFQRALPHATLLHMYGASEAASDTTLFDTRQPQRPGGVPIGKPIANTQVYVLDAHRQPVPIGVAGEIYIGGVSLALGYHGQPALTAERFVPDPFCAEPGARLYRTGDLGRFLADGNLVYLGRGDRQIKLRGMRVELDEVQAVLAAHPAVSECRVVARAETMGGTPGLQLVAYVLGAPGAAPDARALRQHLARRLPPHMVPSAFVRLPAWPLLPNGKLNWQALPAPGQAALPAAGARRPPSTPLEQQLATLWAEALGLPEVGVMDNFFEIGGHSLAAVRLLARLKECLGVEVPLAALFETPTVAELAAALSPAAPPLPAARSLVPIRPGGSRPPLFCVHPVGGGVAEYGAIGKHLHAEQPLYGLRAKGLDVPGLEHLSVEALAADYISELRGLQPTGPYHVGGYSSGGLIAFEMAQQLAAAGERVALLALLDSYAPPGKGRAAWLPEVVLNVLGGLPYWLRDFVRVGHTQMLRRIQRRLRLLGKSRQPVTVADIAGTKYTHVKVNHQNFLSAHYQSILAYEPRPYAGEVTLFRARDQALSRLAGPDKGWRRLAGGGLDLRDFEGSHDTLLTEPFVGHLGRAIQGKLDELNGRL